MGKNMSQKGKCFTIEEFFSKKGLPTNEINISHRGEFH
jgi:hypothetical protein